ncbi:hypothetical protein FQA39_LY14469 [Lamprigera yunnana]|nr:hypothetical protein FQA39_LY14469 [Lamprigera yunnana]
MYSALLVIIFSTNVYCATNNVCSTFKDYLTIKRNPNCWYDVAADQNATNIIKSNGYGVETHKVITPDGYIITLFRIINRFGDGRKVPVLLNHGFLFSGACFIGLGKKSLGFTLADAGYDVWLSNMRGTEYSAEHITLTADDPKFWDFNIDDIGFYDVPAQLTYISQINWNNGKIIYIGHSLGGTVALTYASALPQEARKFVKLFILLAPNGGFTHTNSIIIRAGVSFMGIVDNFTNNGPQTFLSTHGIATQSAKAFCLQSPVFMKACIHFLNYIIMGPQKNIDASIAPIFFNHFPGGSSLKVMKQIVDSARNGLRFYDYDLHNVELYGSLLPPAYNFSKIEVPVYIVYSTSDSSTTEADSEKLYNRLSWQAKRYGRYKITVEDFNHSDFVYGRSAQTILYNQLLELMETIRQI